MSREHLMQIIGAQTAVIDYLLVRYSGVRGERMPREVLAALRELQRLTERPTVDMTQNLIDGVWGVEA